MSKGKRKATGKRGARQAIGYITASVTSIGQPMLTGVIDAARERDVNLICFPGLDVLAPAGFRAQNNIVYALASPESVDGVVSWASVIGHYIPVDELEAFHKRYDPLPIVTIGRTLERFPSLLVDSYDGMREAVTHLIETHGYRRLAFICGPADHVYAQGRYRAYVETLEAHGLSVDPNLITPAAPWGPANGREAARLLLDERGLRPGVDLEAIVAVSEDTLFGALEVLEGRGIRVPDDVAVAGFDDTVLSQTHVPPITTVAASFYEAGRVATHKLLDVMGGVRVPKETVVPSRLVIRHSCGCLDSTVAQAAIGPVDVRGASLESAIIRRRDKVLAAMRQAVSLASQNSDWEERLLDGFVGDLNGESSGAFLSALNGVLREVAVADGEVADWQGVVSVLRRQVSPHLDGQVLRQAEDLWQQARAMVGEAARRAEGHRRQRAEETARTVREIGMALIATFDLDELTDVLVNRLPELGIPACYLSLYENPQPYQYPQSAPEWSRLVLAYDETRPSGSKRIELEPDARRFRTLALAPKGLLPKKRQYSLVLQPLFFQQNQIGFVLFEVGPRDGEIYEALGSQLSGALYGALLVQERRRGEEALAREQYLMNALMDSVPDHIYFKDTDSRFIRISRALANWFGLGQPAQALGKTDFDFFSDEHARPAFEDEQIIVRTGEPLLNVEEKETWPDRPDTWVSTSKMPLRDEEGKIVGTFGISRDITGRKQAELALQKRALQLQTAAEVSRAASSTLDLNELIRQAVDLVRERFDLYYAGLFLVDETGQWAVLRAGTGKAGQKMVKQGHKLEVGGGSMIGWCVANKQARIALDVGAEAVRFEHPLLPKTRSEVALPLISRGEVVGALTIQSAQEAAFSDEDITVLQTMADQLANAVQNARLFEQAQTRTAELAVLDEMTRALTATLDLGTMLESVYQHTSRLMDTSNLYVALYDAQKDEVSFAFYRVDGKPIEHVESRRAGKGLTEYVLRTRQTFLIEENIATQLKELGIEMIGREAQSWLGAPMIAGDQVIGVIAVQSYTTSHVYNERHRDLLSAIANQTAIAVQNARLFDQAQARADEMSILNELSRALSARLTMPEVLAEVYQGASRLVDAANFFVALYDPDSHEVTFPFDTTQKQKDRFLTIPADQGLTGYIIRHRTSVLIEEDVLGWLAEKGIGIVGTPALSWLGVPMMHGDQVLGVMGLQSFTTPRAYDEHDRDLLAALATQTASAITNARLFEQTQAALAEVEATQRRYLERVWGEYARAQEVSGYVQTGAGLTPLDDTLLPEVQQAMRERRTTILEDGGSSVLVVPVTLRGQPLGALGVKVEGGEERWGAEDIALVEGIGEQFALAAENIRLMDETQRRATREQLVSGVATRVRETMDLERVLRTATEEIYQALGLERVMIRLKMAGDGAERQDLAAGGEERETAQEEAT